MTDNPIATSNVRTLASDWSERQVALIRSTCAKDCNPDEFAVFLHRAKHMRLDPLRKQIIAQVHNKNNAEKRSLTVVVTIDGQRVIAQRAGNYRPSSEAPFLEYDNELKGPLNPQGIIRAEVKVYQRDTTTNEWYAITADAWWDEYAPIEDEWDWVDGQRRRTGKRKLRDSWARMPRLMIAKCAEALALRKGWPDDVGGVYDEAEMERAEIIDDEIDASEQARLAKIGYDAKHAATSLMFIFNAGDRMMPVERKQIGARIGEWLATVVDPGQISWFKETNQHNLNLFWAWEPADALAAKQALEAKHVELALADDRGSEDE